jgi:hypothetical protein
MKNALSILLPLVLLCAGSVLLNMIAVWAADTPAIHAHASQTHRAATVMRVAGGVGVDATALVAQAADGGAVREQAR